MEGPRYVALVVSMLVGAVSGLFGLFLLLTTFAFDQTSPVPPYQRWIAGAGVAAVVVFLIVEHGIDDLRRMGCLFTGGVLVVGLVSAVPLWRRLNTIDVTAAGFHRPAYSGTWHDVYVYNATGTPIVICVSTDGACTTRTKFPPRLRAPGRTVAPHDRMPLKWTTGVYGTFTLSITGGLPPQARRETSLTREKPPPQKGV